MGQSSYGALADRDRSVPGLSAVLSGPAISERLQSMKSDIPDVAQLGYVRYKPGTSCIVGYTLEDGRWLHAVARSRSDWPVKVQAYRRLMQRAGRSPMVLDADAVYVAPFPIDNDLPHLWRWLDGRHSPRLLDKLLTQSSQSVRAVRTLAYKYRRRYVGQVSADGKPIAVLRLYADSTYRRLRRTLRTLRSRIMLELPHELGRSHRHRAVAVNWLAGESLDQVLAGQAPLADAAYRTAVALAEFHNQRPARWPRTDRVSRCGLFQALAQMTGQLVPELADRAGRVARQIQGRLLDLPEVVTAIHGDFYAQQAVLRGNRVAIIDLDQAMLGDPAEDVGNCLAHLELQQLYGALAAGRCDDFAGRLLYHYTRTLDDAAVERRVALWQAASLFRLVQHPFRYPRQDWPIWMARILNRVEQRLDGTAASTNQSPLIGCAGTAPWRPRLAASRANMAANSAGPSRLKDDPEFQFVLPALDHQRAAVRLRSSLPTLLAETDCCRLQKIELLRYKPRRRCLIEYELQLQDQTINILGKSRVKGLDTRTFRLQQRLYHQGFDRHAPDQISVPPPLGVLPEWRMWLQARVPGDRSTDLLPVASSQLAHRIAEALHKLHRSAIPCDRRHTMATEYQILAERLQRVAAEHARWRSPIARLLSHCRRLAMTVAEDQTVCLHRDFYPDQVLLDGDRVFLLDLDLFCRGPAAIDVGNFVGHTIEWSLRRTGRPDTLAALEQTFIDRYLQLSDRPLGAAIVACTTLTLARHVAISRRIPERRALTEPLIDLCLQRIDHPRSGHVCSRDVL